MNCALTVFGERGIRRAVHADVAKLAGCAVSTVFLYFPTREDLVSAVLDEVERFYFELADRVHAMDLSAQEILFEHGRQFRSSIDSHPDHAVILLNWASTVRSREWTRYLEFSERMVAKHLATIERGIREGAINGDIDAESAARIIIGYAQTSAQLRLADFDSERGDQIAEQMISAVLSIPASESAA